MNLADKKCVPCRGGVPPMSRSRAQELLCHLDEHWRLNSEGHLERTYTFGDFAEATVFANKVADIAENEGHHPDLHIAWGKCRVEVWTHKINGLTQSDFYLAAKADRALHSSAIICDATNRLRAEAALRDSEAKIRAILDTAVDAIITIDEEGVIESFNRGAERLFGYEAADMLGQNVRMLMPAPYCEEHDQYIANYVQTGVSKIIGIGREVVGRRKDGVTFPMDLAVSEVRLKDRRVFTGIVRDLTQRHQAEARLRALEHQTRESGRPAPRGDLTTKANELLSTLHRLDGLVREFADLTAERDKHAE